MYSITVIKLHYIFITTHNCTATRAFLACLVRIHRNRYFIKNFCKVVNPDTKLIPRCVINRLSQTRIFHHIFYPQIDRSSQVVGRSLRTVQVLLYDEIRLPTYFEVVSPKNLSSLASVFWTFNPPRHDPVRTFEDFFTLTQESRILNRHSVWVCVIFLGLNV